MLNMQITGADASQRYAQKQAAAWPFPAAQTYRVQYKLMLS